MTAGIVAITVPGADGGRELAAWLRDEEELRGRVQLLDAVVVGVTSKSAAAFCRALFGWLRRGRESRVSMMIKRSGAAEELQLDCGAASDADQILDEVRGFLDRA